MTSYYGTDSASGANGANGVSSPNGTTAATPGGNGSAAAAAGGYSFAMTQANLDYSLSLYGGTGGQGGYGGYGGSGALTMSYAKNGAGYTISGTGASTAGQKGGNGGAAGAGGNTVITYNSITQPQAQYLTAQGGSEYSAGGGGNGGSGVYGYYVSNPYANGYYNSSGVLNYYGYTETTVGSAGGAGGVGGKGGLGGSGTITVSNSNLSSGSGSYQPYISASGNYGSNGGNGGSGGLGNVGGVGGAGGAGGAGGNGVITVDHVTTNFYSTAYLHARGNSGGNGGAGGAGGYGQSTTVTYTAAGVATTTYSHPHGVGGRGGTGGAGGNASIDYTNNIVRGTGSNDSLTLTFELTSGAGGIGGDGGPNGGYTAYAAKGANGANGTTHLGFAGNLFDGRAGNDSLTLNLSNTAPGAGNYTPLGAVNINLMTGVFMIGLDVSTIRNVENIDLTLTDGYYLGGVWQNFVAGATLVGNNSANILTSSAGNDSLQGGAGDDALNGDTGADTMSGGLGDDTFYVDNVGDIVTEVAGEGDDTVNATVNFSLVGQYIENLNLTGYVDQNGTGNNFDNVITGNGYVNVLSGGDGDDQLNGNYGNDTLQGGNGDDVLDGGGDIDSMAGGANDDTYYVDNVSDVCTEGLGAGNDTVFSSVTYTLGANIETLILQAYSHINGTGNGIANTLIGNGYDNVLDGAAGADLMIGGTGNDTYVIDNVADVASELAGEGIDTVQTALTWTLGAELENLTLLGAANRNGTGNGLANALTGNAAVNILSGLAGTDTLRGMGGNDNMTGGANADTFVFEHFGAANGIDTVTDFVSGVDKLSFTAADFGWAAGHVLTAAELSLTGTAVGAGAQFVFNPVNNALYWDSNGSAVGGLTGIVKLLAATPAVGDFLFTI